MSRCPFAEWRPLSGPSGAYTSGPYKIVWHTTEGSTLEGALTALGAAHSDSHFVVGRDKAGKVRTRQLIDTGVASRSLRNDPKTALQTNRDSAIQIELVGFAGKAKDRDSLAAARRLARWIEKEHGVPRVWPNGYPKPAKNGKDPGGHNRDAKTWDSKGGHYGHSQVPENTHWDPAYTKEEVDFLMADEVPTATAAAA